MDVEELLAAKDFRLEKLVGQPLYFTPADARAKSEMDRLWTELTGNHPGAPMDLDVKGHKLHVPLASMRVARFSFADLCAKPLGANDFLHVAHAFHTVLIEDIPSFANVQRDVTRRFINLIDTLYDNRVCLIASAAAEPNALYPVERHAVPVRAHRLASVRDAVGRAISRAASTASPPPRPLEQVAPARYCGRCTVACHGISNVMPAEPQRQRRMTSDGFA